MPTVDDAHENEGGDWNEDVDDDADNDHDAAAAADDDDDDDGDVDGYYYDADGDYMKIHSILLLFWFLLDPGPDSIYCAERLKLTVVLCRVFKKKLRQKLNLIPIFSNIGTVNILRFHFLIYVVL